MPVGRQYELDMQRELREYVDSDTVHVALPDMSGSASGSYYDLEIINVDRDLAAFVELKKRKGERGNRSRIMQGGHEGENGIQELTRLVDGAPVWGQTFLGIKFRNCELIVLDAWSLRKHVTQGTYHDDWIEDHGARLTDGGNISMVKPELEDWPSATAGESDRLKLLRQTGFET